MSVPMSYFRSPVRRLETRITRALLFLGRGSLTIGQLVETAGVLGPNVKPIPKV